MTKFLTLNYFVIFHVIDIVQHTALRYSVTLHCDTMQRYTSIRCNATLRFDATNRRICSVALRCERMCIVHYPVCASSTRSSVRYPLALVCTVHSSVWVSFILQYRQRLIINDSSRFFQRTVAAVAARVSRVV